MGVVPGSEWVIAVRLNDGRMYYNASLDRQGQSDWTPRTNQAQRFDTEADAARVAARFETNASAKEYEVVRLPRP
jgi:hypothetical protein